MTTSTITSDLWPDPQLQELAREAFELLKTHLHVRHFRKGNLLWREGDTSGMLVSLKTGRVKIYRVLPAGREATLFLFGPGDVFGFLPFLDAQAYPANAQAIEDVEAEVVARAALLEALRSEPELAMTLIGLLGRRLRASFDLIRSLSTPSARARVAQALLAMVPPSLASAGHATIRLPVTNYEFAGALGLVPETFSRALTGLVQDGVLERTGSGRYRVLDVDGLRRAADPDRE
ncbi:MAG: Crp/Fnr family transcriptional regulator [Candidatus Palauibacterales bacterium]|nr:Crp/Fnr family transcriptional regulator [Candidatus Palauibacterales bacterium]